MLGNLCIKYSTLILTAAWETLQDAYVKNKEGAKELKRPLAYFKAVKVGNSFQQINRTNCNYLYNKHGICEITTFDLTNAESILTTPKLKTNNELEEILAIGNLPFYERITILTKDNAIWRKMTTDYSFKSENKHTSLKEVSDNTKKRQQKLQKNTSRINEEKKPAG